MCMNEIVSTHVIPNWTKNHKAYDDMRVEHEKIRISYKVMPSTFLKKVDFEVRVDFFERDTLWLVTDISVTSSVSNKTQNYSHFIGRPLKFDPAGGGMKLGIIRSNINEAQIDEGEVIFTFKLRIIPSFCCSLFRDPYTEYTCYLNSSLQLLFHLSKFREFLFSLEIDEKKRPIFFQLKELFSTMLCCKQYAYTDELTRSFGWPNLARNIQHDVCDFLNTFIQYIQSRIKNDKNQKKFDKIFKNVFIDRNNSIQNTFILNVEPQIQINEKGQKVYMPLNFCIKEAFNDCKVVQLSDVLFIAINRIQNIETVEYPDKLDLSQSIREIPENCHKSYKIAGFVTRSGKAIDSGHYICYIRLDKSKLWIMFDDQTKNIKQWKYEPKLNVLNYEIDMIIKKSFKEIPARILMYIADDVFEKYISETEADRFIIQRNKMINTNLTGDQNNIVSNATSSCLNNCIYTPKTSNDIKIINICMIEDSIEFISNGDINFQDIKPRYQLELKTTLTYNDVYEKVAETIGINDSKMIYLRTSTKCGLPSNIVFRRNNQDTLSNFSNQEIKLHVEFIQDIENLKINQVPFYFFFFDPTNPTKFTFLTRLVLENNIKFEKYWPMLANILEMPEDTKFVLYSAKFSDTLPKKLVGYVKINGNDKLSNCLSQFVDSPFIYVELLTPCDSFKYSCDIEKVDEETITQDQVELSQCILEENTSNLSEETSDFKESVDNSKKEFGISQENDDSENLNEYSSKFNNIGNPLNPYETKFNEIKKRFKLFYYLKKISNVVKNHYELPNIFDMNYHSVDIFFYKINDRTKADSLTIPYCSNITINQLKRVICCALHEEYPENGLMQLFFGIRPGIPLSSPIYDSCMNSYFKDSFYFSSKAKVSIFYQIFNEYQPNNISIRIYISLNAINCQKIYQILVPSNYKVSDVIDIFKKEINFEYRVLKLADGKISSIMNDNSIIHSNIELKIEKIQKYEKEVIGNIPISYGTIYKNTKYVYLFGIPFYFPVFKDEEFENAMKRLKNMILECNKGESFDLHAINYHGIIRHRKINDFVRILDEKLIVAICIKEIKASNYMNKQSFFKSAIRILK